MLDNEISSIIGQDLPPPLDCRRLAVIEFDLCVSVQIIQPVADTLHCNGSGGLNERVV